MPLLRPGILSPALVHSTLTPNQTCTKLDRGTGYCGGQAGACCGHAMCPHTRFLPLVCRCSGGDSQLGAASRPAGSSPLIMRKYQLSTECVLVLGSNTRTFQILLSRCVLSCGMGGVFASGCMAGHAAAVAWPRSGHGSAWVHGPLGPWNCLGVWPAKAMELFAGHGCGGHAAGCCMVVHGHATGAEHPPGRHC